MNASKFSVPLLCAVLVLCLGAPRARAMGHDMGALGAAEDSIYGMQWHQDDDDPHQVATIANSGSTNTLGYRIVLSPSGRATWEVGSLAVHADIDSDVVEQFYRDLANARPLSKLTPGSGAKSVSFGTSTTITLDGQTSPDLSQAADTRGQALWTDVGNITREVGAMDLPRRPVLEVPEMGPHGHLPSSLRALIHLGPRTDGHTLSVGLGVRLDIELIPPPGADGAVGNSRWSSIEISRPKVLGVVSSVAASDATGATGTTGTTGATGATGATDTTPSNATGAWLDTLRPGTVTLTSHLLSGGKSTATWKVTLHVSRARLM